MMIQGVSNGYYAYQNISNTSGQMYNARPMFTGQVQPAVDTVQFQGQQPEEETFVSKNLGKIILGGLAVAATAYFTHGKLWGKAVEEATSGAGNAANKGEIASAQITATEAKQVVTEETKGLFEIATKEEQKELRTAFKTATNGDKEHGCALDYLLNAPGLTLEEAKQAIARNFHLSEELQSVKNINADKPEVTAKIREFLNKEQTITTPNVGTPAATTTVETKVPAKTVNAPVQIASNLGLKPPTTIEEGKKYLTQMMDIYSEHTPERSDSLIKRIKAEIDTPDITLKEIQELMKNEEKALNLAGNLTPVEKEDLAKIVQPDGELRHEGMAGSPIYEVADTESDLRDLYVRQKSYAKMWGDKDLVWHNGVGGEYKRPPKA